RAAIWATAFTAVAAVMKVTPAAARQRDRRDGVLEDELLLRACLQNHRILVEALDPPRQFDSAHQVDGDVAAFFAGTIEKAVLDCVLLRWFFHLPDSPGQKSFQGYCKPIIVNSIWARLCAAAGFWFLVPGS